MRKRLVVAIALIDAFVTAVIIGDAARARAGSGPVHHAAGTIARRP